MSSGSDDSFDDLSVDGVSFREESSDYGIESGIDSSQSDSSPRVGEEAVALEGASFDASSWDILSNISGSEPSYSASTGSLSRPTPSVAPDNAGENAPPSSSRFSLLTPSLSEPILALYSLDTPSTSSAVSPTGLSILPSREPTGLARNSSYSANSTYDRAEGTSRTPATSESNQEVEIVVVADQDLDHQQVGAPAADLFLGLIPEDDWRFESATSDASNNNHVDIINQALEILQSEHTSPQAHSRAAPWAPGPKGDGRNTIGDTILAPLPGGICKRHYSSMRKRNRRVQANLEAQPGFLGSFCDGNPPQCPILEEDSRNIRPRGSCNGSKGGLQELLPQYRICRAVDCASISHSSLGLLCYPHFAYCHLSRHNISTFATGLIAPGSISHWDEHSIDFYLGFGSPLKLKVCTFIPQKKSDLWSYQKPKGKEELSVRESLPIFLDLFAIEHQASEINDWLDKIIDSTPQLLEYVELMERRQDGDLLVQVLRYLVVWHFKANHMIFRAALKLLMTSTLLSLVPRVKSIPESLSSYISPQPSAANSPHLSPAAPKLLTRQIKASIHHLRDDLLQTLAHYFNHTSQFHAEVRIAIAFLMASVMDLARNAVRSFFKYASTFHPTAVVKEDDVSRYEANMEMQLFDRVRTSVLELAGNTGLLGQSLEVVGMVTKYGQKTTEECKYVSIMIDSLS